MASVGPNNPGTAADGGGDWGWGYPTRALTSNDVYATALYGIDIVSNYLKTTNYSFAIPADATIDGIVVSIERHASNNTGDCHVKDSLISIIKANGSIGATNKAVSDRWPTSDAVVSYGTGTTDKWGETWTPADINNANFGVALKTLHSYYDTTAYVDVITITVYYTEAAAGPAALQGVNGLAKLSCKSVNGLLLASVKSWNGLT